MPELPEVEAMRRMIEPAVIYRRVERAVVLYPRAVRRHDSPEQFVDALEGARVQAVRRRAKYIVCELSTGRSLVMHFGLNGFAQLVAVSAANEPRLPQGTRARLVMGKRSDRSGQADRSEVPSRTGSLAPPAVEMRFVDPRTLGQLFIPPDGGPGSLDELFGQLGPEPLEGAFTPELLESKLRTSGAKVKGRLLDQSVVAGLGNIYTDEALFAAGIRPDRPADRLAPDEVSRLWRAIRLVLEEAIRRESSWMATARSEADRKGLRDGGRHPEWPFSPIEERGRDPKEGDAEDGRGRTGDGAATPEGVSERRADPTAAPPPLAVYRRTGQPCRACGTPIERRRISGRSAHFCPACQR